MHTSKRGLPWTRTMVGELHEGVGGAGWRRDKGGNQDNCDSIDCRSREGGKLTFHWIFFYAVWLFSHMHVFKMSKHYFNKISLMMDFFRRNDLTIFNDFIRSWENWRLWAALWRNLVGFPGSAEVQKDSTESSFLCLLKEKINSFKHIFKKKAWKAFKMRIPGTRRQRHQASKYPQMQDMDCISLLALFGTAVILPKSHRFLLKSSCVLCHKTSNW